MRLLGHYKPWPKNRLVVILVKYECLRILWLHFLYNSNANHPSKSVAIF